MRGCRQFSDLDRDGFSSPEAAAVKSGATVSFEGGCVVCKRKVSFYKKNKTKQMHHLSFPLVFLALLNTFPTNVS